jgi:hypothetical protein
MSLKIKRGVNCSKKWNFTLKDINTETVDKRFNISIVSNIDKVPENPPQNTTRIVDLVSNRSKTEIVSFIDEAKKPHRCIVSMIDFHTNKDLTNNNIHEYFCFWCKSKIPPSFTPLGCPIHYHPIQAIKTYYSEISKDTYTIKENVTNRRYKIIKDGSDPRLSISQKEHFLTDGVFCSFNCCMAFIKDNDCDSFYNKSEMLLLKMYNDMYPDNIPQIQKAPHWRTLHKFGGNLTIEQFRNSFNKIEYKELGLRISKKPKFKPQGVLFEEKLKF